MTFKQKPKSEREREREMEIFHKFAKKVKVDSMKRNSKFDWQSPTGPTNFVITDGIRRNGITGHYEDVNTA